MACFFGHKWEGCTCRRCGKTRNQDHDFRPVPNECREKCSRCGQTRSLQHIYQPVPGKCQERCTRCGKPRDLQHSFSRVEGKCIVRCDRCGKTKPQHDYKNGFCTICGRQSEKPFDLRGLNGGEMDALRKALEIAKAANKEANLNPVYDSAMKQLNQKDLGPTEVAIAAVSLSNVSQALAQTAGQFNNSNPQEAIARAVLALTMQNALKKINDVMTAFNKEAERRNGSGEYESAVRSVFKNYESSLLVDETGTRWEENIRGDIDKLVSGGDSALVAMHKAMNACALGLGSNYDESWWYGAKNLVRIFGKFPPEQAQDKLLTFLEMDSKIVEWFTYVQKESAAVLANVANADAVPRLEKILQKPFSFGPNDELRALLKKLKALPVQKKVDLGKPE